LDDIYELIRTATQPVNITTCGDSMLPTITPGVPVLVQPSSGFREIHKGDIVVFLRGRKIVCHRVIFSLRLGHREFVYEKGDNNYLGRLIPAAAVIGKVIGVAGNNKIPSMPVRLTPGGLLIRRAADSFYRLIKYRKNT